MTLRTFCSLSRMEDLADYLQAKNLPTREGKGQFQAMQVYINGKWEILYLSNAYPDSCFTVGASPLKLLLELFLKGEKWTYATLANCFTSPTVFTVEDS